MAVVVVVEDSMQQDVLSQYEYYLYFPVYNEKEKFTSYMNFTIICTHTQRTYNYQCCTALFSLCATAFHFAALFFCTVPKRRNYIRGTSLPLAVNSFNDLLVGECELKCECERNEEKKVQLALNMNI